MTLCLRCLSLGVCRVNRAQLVTDQELSDPVFRNHLNRTARGLDVPDHKWHGHLSDMYRDFNGVIVDADGLTVSLEMDVFETTSIREWFRDWVYNKEYDRAPRLRAESRERVRILGTLIRAHYPAQASLWGKVPANDN